MMTQVATLEPIYLQASMQIVKPSPDESMKIIYDRIVNISNTLTSQTDQQNEVISLLSVMNTTLYHQNTDTDFTDEDVIILLQEMHAKMDAIAGVFASLPEWIPAHTLKESTGLGVDAIRKQLHNPKYFEPEVDYKKIGSIWHINKNAIPKVRRQK